MYKYFRWCYGFHKSDVILLTSECLYRYLSSLSSSMEERNRIPASQNALHLMFLDFITANLYGIALRVSRNIVTSQSPSRSSIVPSTAFYRASLFSIAIMNIWQRTFFLFSHAIESAKQSQAPPALPKSSSTDQDSMTSNNEPHFF